MEIIDFVTLPDGEIDFEGKAKELLQFKGTKKDIAKKVEELKIRYAEQKPYVESNQRCNENACKTHQDCCSNRVGRTVHHRR